jgi:hypothetical protein
MQKSQKRPQCFDESDDDLDFPPISNLFARMDAPCLTMPSAELARVKVREVGSLAAHTSSAAMDLAAEDPSIQSSPDTEMIAQPRAQAKRRRI